MENLIINNGVVYSKDIKKRKEKCVVGVSLPGNESVMSKRDF